MASTSSLGAQSNTSAIQAQSFYNEFNAILRDVKERIDKSSKADDLGPILEDIAKARTNLTDNTDKLPSYDRQTHEQHLKKINILLDKKRSLLVPRAKFAFKRNEKSQQIAKAEVAEIVEATTLPSLLTENLTNTDDSPTSYLSIRDKRDETLSLNNVSGTRQKEAADLHVLNLHNCIVDLRNLGEENRFLALQLRSLHRCVILCGSINGSTMIHNCSQSVVSLECKQFRMHSSVSMAIFISTSSVATIEHCQRISFASYLPFKSLPNIQDFDHISTLQASSNWSAMDSTAQNRFHDGLVKSPLNLSELLEIIEAT